MQWVLHMEGIKLTFLITKLDMYHQLCDFHTLQLYITEHGVQKKNPPHHQVHTMASASDNRDDLMDEFKKLNICRICETDLGGQS